MRTCGKCGNPNETTQAWCKPCRREYDRARWKTTGPEVKERKRQNQNARSRRLRKLTMEYLSQHPCVDCGEADPIVLEFDHRDDVEKLHNVSEMAHRNSWVVILQEIAKCDVRCANCHRRRTALQFAWYTE